MATDLQKAAPEYEDCRAAAQAHNVPLRSVYEAALAAWHNQRQDLAQQRAHGDA